MNLDDYLNRATILDCHGQVAFELTLLLNGDVFVRSRQGEFHVNPSTRLVSPPGRVVSPDVIDQAVAFARSCL
ncbi:MAG: hypothetical protein ACKOJG_07070 [Actinomycetota bacterium]